MAIPLYLAKTAAEFASAKEQPPHLAWMACHFSPYGTGLTNLPPQLPPQSLLILNDRTPVHGHDPGRIKETLEKILTQQNCCGLLLDFQRPDCPETAQIIKALEDLSFPVCVSEQYAQELDCPVLLPPVPITAPVEEYLSPWQGREIWLEAAIESVSYAVTETGCIVCSGSAEGDFLFCEEHLHCHYRIEVEENSAQFYINRNSADLFALLESAASLGVTRAVGLWQELRDIE